MPQMFTRRASDRHPVLPDIGRPHVAKATVRESDITRQTDVDWKVRIAETIQQVVREVFGTNQVAAHEIDVDDAEFGKWMNGTRRPHMDRLYAHPRLRGPLALAMAKLDTAIRVEIVLRKEA